MSLENEVGGLIITALRSNSAGADDPQRHDDADESIVSKPHLLSAPMAGGSATVEHSATVRTPIHEARL